MISNYYASDFPIDPFCKELLDCSEEEKQELLDRNENCKNWLDFMEYEVDAPQSF